jgi:hypothetical protein
MDSDDDDDDVTRSSRCAARDAEKPGIAMKSENGSVKTLLQRLRGVIVSKPVRSDFFSRRVFLRFLRFFSASLFGTANRIVAVTVVHFNLLDFFFKFFLLRQLIFDWMQQNLGSVFNVCTSS